ncbi:Tim17/Tim22/Tim23/Pmp24 family-domain-containing protein [Gaertneriomyces semiglobifer]|nr:Tim17/Tim22/Tim23/Pmp24 family-domain-containing protein [Gaertneriomyces semiglobifer]
MLSGLQSSSSHPDALQKKLVPLPPVPEDEQVELLYITDALLPLPTQNAPRPTGSFGPLPMRTNYDKLLYGVGTAYMAGLTFGGGYGALRGLRTAQVPTLKVRMNNLMNQSTRYGPWAANSLGIMTMSWALIDNTIEYFRGGQADYYNHIAAAFTSGFIFKCTAGMRPAVLTGSILASVVGAYGVFDTLKSGGMTIPKIGGGPAQPASA